MGGIYDIGGENKAHEICSEVGIQALPNAAIYRGGKREGGSLSGLLSGTQIPKATFPFLQVPASFTGHKGKPHGILPSLTLPRGTRADKFDRISNLRPCGLNSIRMGLFGDGVGLKGRFWQKVS